MWITGDVELPEEVLDAHERGELVFFVGAGVSLDAPSNLPLFGRLAEILSEKAAHPFVPDEGLDYFIGRLELLPPGFDAHRHTHEIISDSESRFNTTHKVIAELAQSSGKFRVVTTNYDNHIASAVNDVSGELPDIWCGPALPLGDCFEGIVHLHGSILRPSGELILTDRDFGRSYLTDAWATRFLLPMFKRFTVVFIGYSHDDTIMRYLALGLPSAGKNRYAFTSEPENYKWKYLGIKPIGYPVQGNSHRALTDALNAWSDRVKMGKADHQARLLEIISSGKSNLLPPDQDYLCVRLETEEGVRDFVKAIDRCSEDEKLDWLDWIESIDIFKKLFNADDASEVSKALAQWFAESFIASSSLNGAALQVIHRMGQSMSDVLFRASMWALDELRHKDEEAGLRWETLLSTSIRGQSAPLDARLFYPFNSKLKSCGIPLLAVLLRPSLVLTKRFLIDATEVRKCYPDADISWNIDKYLLTQYIQAAADEYPPGDPRIGTLLENSITESYALLEAYYGSREFDLLSFNRLAIESHEQNSFSGFMDALIDGLRDYGIKALPMRQNLPDKWWDFKNKLMQRLALHLVTVDKKRSSDQKLEWLLNRAGLYQFGLKHETYQLLAKALPDTSSKQKERVLAAAELGPDIQEDSAEDRRHIAYSKFNLLTWLVQSDSSWQEAQGKLEQVQQQNPDFKVREHPDFDRWRTSGSWGGTLPMEVNDFVNLVEDSVETTLKNLVSQEYSQRAFGEPSWDDVLELIEKATRQRPDLGLRLWDVIAIWEDLSEKQSPIWGAIVRGWGEAELGDSELEIINRLNIFCSNPDSVETIADFLLKKGHCQTELAESVITTEMRKLARSLWDTHGATFIYPKNYNPLSSVPLYLNSWPGKLARYWGYVIEGRWRKNRDGWNGLNSEESDALISLLSGNSKALDATQPAIAGELFFYFAADERFAIQYILPIFNDPCRHIYAWFPYLRHPRYNDRLLEAGLLKSLRNEFTRINTELYAGGEMLHRFLELVISIVSYAGISDSDRSELLKQSVVGSDGAYILEFSKAVERFIKREGVDSVAIWGRWLGEHVRNRINGVPRLATASEMSVWANLVPYLGERIHEAVNMLSGENIGFSGDYSELMIPSDIIDNYGEYILDFLVERIRSTDSEVSLIGRQVWLLVEEFQGVVGADEVQRLVDVAVERGFIEIE